MGRFRRVRAAVAAGLIPLVVLSGCYSYLPVERPTPREGVEVRARLAAPQSFQLGTAELFNIGELEGQIARVDDDSLVVWTSKLRTWGGGDEFWGEGAMLVVPHERVGTFEERRFSAGRTVLLGAALSGVVGLMVVLAEALGGFGGNPPNGDGTLF